MRLLKDDTEIAALKKAVSISVQAHHAMMRACKQARYEYHLDALWRYHVMHQGVRSGGLSFDCGRRQKMPAFFTTRLIRRLWCLGS